jgi:CheY-like chemotaxis protein
VIAILTESVRNALRHADATHIWIDGLVDRSLITVAVHDDGKGFDLSQLPRRPLWDHGNARACRSDRCLHGDPLDAKGTLVSDQLEGRSMIRVWIADDHTLFAQGLSRALGVLPDIRVVGIAASGTELIEKIDTQPAEVAITDLEMPGGGGAAVLKRTHRHPGDRRHHAHRRLPAARGAVKPEQRASSRSRLRSRRSPPPSGPWPPARDPRPPR